MKKITLRLFSWANIIVVVMMLAAGYAAGINPVSHPYLSLFGFLFPAFLTMNLAFIAFWLFVSRIRLFIPVAGFLMAYSPVQWYSPTNVAEAPPEGSLKVLTYNVLGFHSPEHPFEGAHPVLQYIERSGADIICLQEYTRVACQDSMWNIVDSIYPYHASVVSQGYVQTGGAEVAVYSKYPITSYRNIDIYTRGNTVGAFTLDINGDSLYLVNAHLETIGFSPEEKQQFNDMVRGRKESGEMRREARTMVSKLAESAKVRAPQADAIARYISKHKGERMIVCGDLNDHPLSYVHHTIARGLTDCYRAAGRWPGFSFRYHSMYVRIDNIMCSEHWKPYRCEVDKSIDFSDHYPVYCFLYEENSP